MRECVTRDGGTVGRGGDVVAIRQRFEALRCVTYMYVRLPVKIVGRIRLGVALLCARFQASSIHSRIGPGKRLEQSPVFQACIGQWPDT